MKVVLISTDENRVGMGVKTLSACLLSHGFETSIVLMSTSDENYLNFAWDDLLLLCRDAGLVAISCMTHGMNKAVEVKDNLAGRIAAPVIIGGIHASLDPESAIRSFPLVCHGEGEDLIVELARRLENYEPIDDIPGLWLNRDGAIIRNTPVPLSKDLNDYPFPDYDITRLYVLEAGGLVPARPIPLHMSIDDFVVLGSRGCPHHCTYCCSRKIKHEFPWRSKVVHYTTDYLIENLKAVRKEYPEVKSFWIEDDTFFAKSLDEIRIFTERYKNEVALPFQVLISPWTYKKEKLDLLVGVGMTKLIMGIQSGSERVNYDVYDRKIANKKTLEIAHSLHEYSALNICYDFIGMNPFEEADDLINTIEFIKSLPQPYVIYNNNLAFYPGTVLHEKAMASGIDVAMRVKHSDPRVGFNIIIRENLSHKFFHLLLLLMGGRVTAFRFGCVPRFLVAAPLLRFYYIVEKRDPKIMNGAAVLVAFVLYHWQWKKLVKKVLGPKTVTKIRHLVFKVTKKSV
ncbi:MAG: B12-binding domain-containing radical SAM protein [Geobacter sp.]|nr:B12-binding domain-containing radical SAM protein [Geobacter sp.]